MRSMSLSVRPKRSTVRSSASSENLGNLGVFKVLGEAFMRRFNAYSDQVRNNGGARRVDGWTGGRNFLF